MDLNQAWTQSELGNLGAEDRRKHRTHDQAMGLGVFTPIPTISVMNVRAGPSEWTLTDGCATIDPIRRTLGLGVDVALAPRSKKVLSFDNSSLIEVREEFTSGFHSPNALSNTNSIDSREATHSSHYWSTSANSERRLLTMDSCAAKPSWICFMNS
jgi:hypothetical protein